MQRLFLKKSLFLIWSTFVIVVSVYTTNQVDFIHGAVFAKNELLLFPLKMMRIEPFGYIGSLLWSFTVAALFSLACVSLGIFLIWQLIKSETEAEQLTLPAWAAMFCTAFLAGHAVFSIVFISLAASYQFTIELLIPVVFAGFIIGFPSLKRMLSLFPANRKIKLGEIFKSNDYKWMFVLSIIIIFLCLMYSSSRLSYDAVAFYFSDEKITAITKHIQFFRNDLFVASSFQAGISYAALIKISGEQAARIYTWMNGLVIIIFGLAIGEKVGLSKQARLIALILLLTSTAFLDLTGDGKVEIISTAAAMAAVYWTIGNTDKRSSAIFFLTGTLAGLAIASRPYNAFLVCAFVGIYFLVKMYFNKGHGILSLLKSSLWIGAGVLCLVITHLFVNWVILGDAFAFLKNLQAVDSPGKWHWTITPDNIWVIRLLYPLSVTFINIPQSDGNISPLFICALAGILMRISRNRIKIARPLIEVTFAAAMTLGVWLCLIYTVFEIRYVLFLWVLLFMPIAAGIENLLALEDLLLKRFVQSMLIFLLFFSAIRTVFISIDTYSPVDKLGDSHCYEYLYCDLSQPINSLAPLGSRILALNAFKYYLRSDLFMCLSKHEEYSILQDLSLKDTNAFWLEVYRQGYQYITYEKIFNSQHLRFGIVPNPNETPSWLRLEPIYGKPGDDVVSYKIDVDNPPVKIESTCVENEPGIWKVQSLANNVEK